MEVSARDVDTGDESTTSSVLEFQSLVTADQPVVTPTVNSLVFLYSAPACDAGSLMRVQFWLAGGTIQQTPSKTCSAGLSMNFYLAGLMANSTYTASHMVETGSAVVTDRKSTRLNSSHLVIS